MHWPPLQIVPKNETRKKNKKQLLYKSAMQVLKAEKNVSSKTGGKNTKLCMINTICKPTGNSRRRKQPKPVTLRSWLTPMPRVPPGRSAACKERYCTYLYPPIVNSHFAARASWVSTGFVRAADGFTWLHFGLAQVTTPDRCHFSFRLWACCGS
jgi:hypothetical protein